MRNPPMKIEKSSPGSPLAAAPPVAFRPGSPLAAAPPVAFRLRRAGGQAARASQPLLAKRETADGGEAGAGGAAPRAGKAGGTGEEDRRWGYEGVSNGEAGDGRRGERIGLRRAYRTAKRGAGVCGRRFGFAWAYRTAKRGPVNVTLSGAPPVMNKCKQRRNRRARSSKS